MTRSCELEGVTLELTVGDITRQDDMAAVVNAANAELAPGGGVAGAIHRAAGPGLVRECRPLAPIRPGQAVVTSGHQLPNPWVVHVLGPVYGRDEPSDAVLDEAYRNALRAAAAKEIDSLAFPAISTGAFGFPMDTAARIALAAVAEEAPQQPPIARVRFVLVNDRDLKAHATALDALRPAG